MKTIFFYILSVIIYLEGEIMKIVIIENNKVRLNLFFDWLIYMIGYAIVLITASVLFKSINIDNSMFGLWAFVAAIMIYILNKTIKPIIVILTLPLIGITLGLFYFIINLFVLKIVDFVLMGHFETTGIISLFFVSILISIMNFLVEKTIVEPIVRGHS